MPLYSIRFPYGWTIQAKSQEEAHAIAVKRLKDAPEGAISAVEDATLGRPRSLLTRLLTGK